MNDTIDSHTQQFLDQQKRLESIAYRMLGNLHEAEELVQDVFIQWHKLPSPDEVNNPGAFLTTLTVRRCLDLIKSAAKQRESYPGPWLPTPLVTEWSPLAEDPAQQLSMSQTLSTAFMLLLERLSPLERAVFVLRQGFDLSYQDIAGSVDQSAAYCRQLYKRAQHHIASDKDRFEVHNDDHQTLFNQFMQALADADVAAIKEVLAVDAITYSDGGGKALAALRPIYGQDKVARFIAGVARKGLRPVSARFCTINHLPGVILFDGDKAITALSAQVINHKIRALYIMRNPDKLQHLHAPAN